MGYVRSKLAAVTNAVVAPAADATEEAGPEVPGVAEEAARAAEARGSGTEPASESCRIDVPDWIDLTE